MITIIVVVWLINLFIFTPVLATYLKQKYDLSVEDEDVSPTQGCFLMLGLVSAAIGFALYYDIYGHSPNPLIESSYLYQWAAISGFVYLGVCALISIVLVLLKWMPSNTYQTEYGPTTNGFNIGVLVIEGIGLLASILGIISFYMDYLH
jgi:uncharacterized membrane protein YhaH (DUF805 family)